MPKIQTPVLNNLNAPIGPTSIDSFQSGFAIDKLRQFVIFELVDLKGSTNTIPQSQPIFPYMVLHVNPESLEENYSKIINRQATRGGFLEQHWGEELTELTCSLSTGSFITMKSGLSVLNRKASIAYRKYLELVALYHNNGLVYDQRGNVIYDGSINMHFDSNIYNGYFENLTVSETADKAFTFNVNFTFKVKFQYRTVGY